MATAKKTKSKAAGISEESLKGAYREWLLMNGKEPASVFQFAAANKITEAEFYSYFGSFDALEKSIWRGYAETVISRLHADDNYPTFSAREKVLAFYFTLIEVLKNDRSFVLMQWKGWRNKTMFPTFLKTFKLEFDAWIAVVIAAGKSQEEIAKRPYLDKNYDGLFWMHLLFVLQFWSHDDSTNFEQTDVAIEKSVNLGMDLIGKGVLDNALDFGKFLYQNSKN